MVTIQAPDDDCRGRSSKLVEDIVSGKNRFDLRVFFLMLVMGLGRVAGAVPQTTTGAVDGTVADQTGAVLPNVEVTLKNVDTGVTRTIVTDDRGSFRALLLPVGRYDVSMDLK